MNPVVEQMNRRRSVRNFSGKPVDEVHLGRILLAAQQAPTSINGQQISLVVTRNKETIARIAEIAGGQPQVAGAEVFVTVVIDYHRTREALKSVGAEQVIAQSAEGLMVGATDAGIMLNALQTAAESFGYGTTAIGGIRNDPQAMIELLGLPAETFPLVGTTIGVADDASLAQVKPRVPLATFAHMERYDAEAVRRGVAEYDRQLRLWWDEQGLTQMPSYSESTAQYYSRVYFPKVAESLESQGFEFRDD
ncbi:NADPH-dependent oxidoreductase [Ferrimonas sediminicola]|uniref:NADPH-dependent oxidoreductase n=1 Tax=Ferrimonas sediminicola TaxID=2569538 RepID=A0A4U1BBV6_9GAMM|nr:nitroreductase family protein [Ferrimonas sediminicola]TKB48431.1 NADPH-dependent oxidoreductase [Ferrimonas sediminicola]